MAGTNLYFVRTIRAVFWGGDGGGPPAGMVISKVWGKTPRRNALFFDKDVRADRPSLVEEGRTTRTEEFRDVDGRYTDELVFAPHRDLVCGREIG